MRNSDRHHTSKENVKGKYVFIFLFLSIGLFSAIKTLAQFREVGGGIGAFNYSGDLAPVIDPMNFRPAATFFYIRNFPKAWSAKASITGGRISASDASNNDVLATLRNAQFSNNLVEVALSSQYHFLDYRGEKRLVKFSPYFTIGTGMAVLFRNDKSADYSLIQLVVPMGLGIKWNVSSTIDLGVEFTARKTFTDYLDDVSRAEITVQSASDYRFGSWNEDDWYYFAGFTLSYLFYDIHCPNPWHRRFKVK